MASTLVFQPGFRVLDASGRPVSGAQIRFFEAGTSTPKSVYSDAALEQALGSIVYTRSDGLPVASEVSSTVVLVYTGEDPYKVDILKSDDTTLYPAQDNIVGAPAFEAGEAVAPFVPVITTGSNVTLGADDRGKLYVCQSNTVTIPAATTLGDGWNVRIRNGHTSGRVVISAASGISYQSLSVTTLRLEPGQAVSLACDGTAYRVYAEAQIQAPAGMKPNTPGVITVDDRISSAPTSSAGKRWLVSSAFSTYATGDILVDHGGDVFDTHTPPTDAGWIAYVKDEDRYYAFIGSAWVENGLQAAASDTLAGRIEIATTAEMETATDATRAVTPGRQHRHPGHPKAGGNFNGSGTPAFRSGDYGMGAITDNDIGDYTLALDTAFNDTNYWITGWARSISSGEAAILTARPAGTKTSSTISVMTIEDSGDDVDSTEVGVTFWGDYA